MKGVKSLLGLLAVAGVSTLKAYSAAAVESAKLLTDLKPGSSFSITQDVDVPIPGLLKGMTNPSGILIETGGHLAPFFMGTSGAVCLVEDSALEFKDPDSFKLSKGAEFVVKSAGAEKRGSALYVGPATRVVVEAAPSVGMHLMAKLLCYPGAPGKLPISVAAFEQLFAGKIKAAPSAKPR